MNKETEAKNDDVIRSLTGSKRVDALVFTLILSGLGTAGVSVTKDTRDRFYGDDGRRLKSEIIHRIDKDETQSRLRDAAIKNDISSLRSTIERHHIEALTKGVQTDNHEKLLDKLEREIDEHMKGH